MATRRKQVAISAFREEQDEWDRQLSKEIGLAIGQWLIDAKTDLNRRTRSLIAAELTSMSRAAIAKYQDLRQQREQELKARRDPLLADGSSDTPG